MLKFWILSPKVRNEARTLFSFRLKPDNAIKQGKEIERIRLEEKKKNGLFTDYIIRDHLHRK
jgi:hypothetical protein